MKTCPSCGHENNAEDRFCANCGNRLTPTSPKPGTTTESAAPVEPDNPAPAPEEPAPSKPASSIPPPVTPSFAQQGNPWDRNNEPVDDEWKMSDLGPPPGRKRPVWLWILIAFFLAILLCCILGFVFFNYTDTGQQIWDDAMATSEALATEQAD